MWIIRCSLERTRGFSGHKNRVKNKLMPTGRMKNTLMDEVCWEDEKWPDETSLIPWKWLFCFVGLHMAQSLYSIEVKRQGCYAEDQKIILLPSFLPLCVHGGKVLNPLSAKLGHKEGRPQMNHDQLLSSSIDWLLISTKVSQLLRWQPCYPLGTGMKLYPFILLFFLLHTCFAWSSGIFIFISFSVPLFPVVMFLFYV